MRWGSRFSVAVAMRGAAEQAPQRTFSVKQQLGRTKTERKKTNVGWVKTHTCVRVAQKKQNVCVRARAGTRHDAAGGVCGPWRCAARAHKRPRGSVFLCGCVMMVVV